MSAAKALPLNRTPPLESGDCLDRLEFERRYDADPTAKRAELIDGVVYVASPIRAEYHGDQQAALLLWLGTYALGRPDLTVSGNSSLRLDDKNEPQPDGSLRIRGGSAPPDPGGYLAGAPELVFEVAASSASYDLHQKKQLYRRTGVQEYIVWRVFEGAIDWFSLEDGEYEAMQPDENGLIQSKVFPGLRLNGEALLTGDLATVLAELSR